MPLAIKILLLFHALVYHDAANILRIAQQKRYNSTHEYQLLVDVCEKYSGNLLASQN